MCAHRLLPHVEKIVRAAADPELREVATNALSLLERVSREGQEAAAEPAANKVDWQVRGVVCFLSGRDRVGRFQNAKAST